MLKVLPIKYGICEFDQNPIINGVEVTLCDDGGGRYICISTDDGEVSLNMNEFNAITQIVNEWFIEGV
jgi:hypothetical protein